MVSEKISFKDLKTGNFTKNVWFINFFAPINFEVFDSCYFLQYRLQRAENPTNCSG